MGRTPATDYNCGPTTTTGGAGVHKTQSVRVERFGAPDLLGLALNLAEAQDCDSAPGDSDGDADDCGDVHLGARFQDLPAIRPGPTQCKRLGLVAVDSVDVHFFSSLLSPGALPLRKKSALN